MQKNIRTPYIYQLDSHGISTHNFVNFSHHQNDSSENLWIPFGCHLEIQYGAHYSIIYQNSILHLRDVKYKPKLLKFDVFTCPENDYKCWNEEFLAAIFKSKMADVPGKIQLGTRSILKEHVLKCLSSNFGTFITKVNNLIVFGSLAAALL